MGHLLAHREPGALDAVHRLHAVRQLELPIVRHDGIHPGGSHGPRGGEDVRPGDHTALHGALHVHVGVHRPLGLQVADRREAVLQRDARVARRENSAVGSGLVQQLLVVRRGRRVALQQQMRVRVDQPRENGHLGKIDDAGALRLRLKLSQRADGLDAVPFDENTHGAARGLRTAVDQTTGLYENRLGRRRPGGLRGQRGSQCQGDH